MNKLRRCTADTGGMEAFKYKFFSTADIKAMEAFSMT